MTAPVMPLARKLGELLDAKPIETLRPIDTSFARPVRKDLWPADVWAEMQAIYRGEDAAIARRMNRESRND